MSDKVISCPKCGTSISITDALSSDIKEQYQREFRTLSQKKDDEVKALLEKVNKDKEELERRTADADRLIREKLKAETAALEAKLKSDILSQGKVELDDLKSQLKEKEAQAAAAQTAELELRKKTRELEEKQKSLDLELNRKLDEERIKIEEAASVRINEANRLKTAEKDKQLSDMRNQIEDLKRKAEQGSQQTQGEVLELELETALKQMFPNDEITPVGKGQRGADVVQKVISSNGVHLGTILWELKRTKAWQSDWTSKLKDDQREISADVAVIVTTAMPKDFKSLGLLDGVWVSDLNSYTGIAAALRKQIIEVSLARASGANRGEKMAVLYDYLTGVKFRQKIESILETYQGLKDDLETEKRAFAKMWKNREARLESVLISTAEMYGELQGIAGSQSLPNIKILELPDGDG